MNAAVTVNKSNAMPPIVSSVQDILLNRIQETKTNPRRTFDEAKLAELSANIHQYGVLQPVLVRPLPDGEDGFYELVAGARRYRASKLAGRETIPATIRELTSTRNASDYNSSKTCNVPMCTNSTKREATPLSCNCNRTPTPSRRSPRKSGVLKNTSMPGCACCISLRKPSKPSTSEN